jgi:outer membrane protein assembly factor BamE (lipoprotein component of BamABCDE complex)
MRIFSACALALLLAAPSLARDKQIQDDPNTLTHGMVQMTLKVGETSQGQILETFGAPNITSIDGSGQEMWVYDRHATVTSNNSSGFSIGMLMGAGGGDVGGGAGLGFGKKKSKSSQSSRTMTLIIKFNDAKIVSDFRSRSSSF